MANQQTLEVSAERVLVERIAAGDEGALGELYDALGAPTFSLALRMLGNQEDAEEVVADAFAQVWRSASDFDARRGSVAAWLVTIARSRALDRLRSRKRSAQRLERAASLDSEGFALPMGATEASPDRRVERREIRETVLRVLAMLPEPQQRVLELAYFDGLSQSEIADATGQPLGTVKTRVRAGLEKLRQELAPWFGREAP